MKEECRKLIRSIIFIMMGLQIIMGAVWGVMNLGAVPYFEESAELLTMSKSLVVDEYTGFLFVLCIRILFTVGQVLGIPGCSLLYVLQLLAAGLAYGYFLKKVAGCEGKKIWFYAGFVLTIPCIIQCHMAVLPYSLVSSVFVVLLGRLTDLWHRKEQICGKQLLYIGVLWIVSALLLPDFGVLSGFAVGVSVLYYMICSKKVLWQMLVLCLAGRMSIGAVEAVVCKEGSMGKMQRSVEAALLQRFVWPNFVTFGYLWGEEVHSLWDVDELSSLNMYPEQVIYKFGPIMEQTYGKERANEIYLDMAKIAFGVDTKNIILNMVEDMGAYVCPPMTMLLQLKGVGESYTGWNYARMKDNAPAFAGYYVEYALYTWPLIGGLGVGLSLVAWMERRKSAKMAKAGKLLRNVSIGSFLGVVSVGVNLWYVMSSGNMQDYKKLLVNSVLWSLLLMKIVYTAHIDKP